jgi:hypothetical protein
MAIGDYRTYGGIQAVIGAVYDCDATIWRRDGHIMIRGGSRVPPALREILQRRKAEIMPLLRDG